MAVLQWLDSASDGLPALAQAVTPTRESLVPPLFGSVWGLMLVGLAMILLRLREKPTGRGRRWLALRIVAVLVLGILLIGFWDGQLAWYEKAEGPVGAAARLAVAVAGSKGFLVAITTIGLSLALRRHAWGTAILKWAGLALVAAATLFVATTMAWPQPTHAFLFGSPAWLGQAELLVPALIFWGFPWVGVVSVLLYLAGLGNIGQDIYDAAEIDGCGWFRKFWNIELPLILTQVRLNLILMIIGTLQGWGLIFVLLGDTGGPKGAGMVPGLYMFRKAFTDMEAGYAVAIGLLLFFLTLALTLINNRYVRVEK
ncbi:MAG: sugar ABC transporter permease [Planctomycetes bacterium]|nr:sugar ABC transporter permease [Planctomycetota bacterium]